MQLLTTKYTKCVCLLNCLQKELDRNFKKQQYHSSLLAIQRYEVITHQFNLHFNRSLSLFLFVQMQMKSGFSFSDNSNLFASVFVSYEENTFKPHLIANLTTKKLVLLHQFLLLILHAKDLQQNLMNLFKPKLHFYKKNIIIFNKKDKQINKFMYYSYSCFKSLFIYFNLRDLLNFIQFYMCKYIIIIELFNCNSQSKTQLIQKSLFS
ncbi:hypothetical protein ABPG72_017010 [Tetrahymena utriculariae]